MKRTTLQMIGGALGLALAATTALATPPGVPEPGLVMYGKITNVQGGETVPLDSIVMTAFEGFIPASASTEVVQIGGQPHYVARVKFDTRNGGSIPQGTAFSFDPVPNSFELVAVSPGYDRTALVNVGTQNYAVTFSPSTFDFSAADRGTVVRVDITINANPYEVWAASIFGDPFLPQALIGANPDGDEDNNGGEFAADTNPLDAGSFLRVADISDLGSDFELTWPSVPGKLYDVIATTDLAGGSWTAKATDVPGEPGATTTHAVPKAPGAANEYFRIETTR